MTELQACSSCQLGLPWPYGAGQVWQGPDVTGGAGTGLEPQNQAWYTGQGRISGGWELVESPSLEQFKKRVEAELREMV